MVLLLQVITFIDLAGHEKYLKTTVFGMTGHAPDFSMLMVCTIYHLNPIISQPCHWSKGSKNGTSLQDRLPVRRMCRTGYLYLKVGVTRALMKASF